MEDTFNLSHYFCWLHEWFIAQMFVYKSPKTFFLPFSDTLISGDEFGGIVLSLLWSKLRSCCFIYCFYKSSWKQPHCRDACDFFFFLHQTFKKSQLLVFYSTFLCNIFQTLHKTSFSILDIVYRFMFQNHVLYIVNSSWHLTEDISFIILLNHYQIDHRCEQELATSAPATGLAL